MLCVQQETTGALTVMNPQPADLTTCALVIQSYPESASSLTQIDEAGGSLIAGSVLGLWALAWVIRQIARSLNVDQPEKETTS